MAGKTNILEAGQTLFKKGDQSDGMYLVRQGEFMIYLEQEGHEVTLAKITTGGMIGEMALFDQKPRSASVKALVRSEVTQITNEDFQKLMKQIPKWFTSLMTTLSGRLRTTNDRLQQLESKASVTMPSMSSALRLMGALELLWHRDGSKDGKEWVLDKQPAVITLAAMFAEELSFVEKVVTALMAEKIITLKKDSLKRDVLILPNRGAFSNFIKFLASFIKTSSLSALPVAACDLLRALALFSEKSAYETFATGLAELEIIGQKEKMRTMQEWPNHLAQLGIIHGDVLQISGSGLTLSIKTKKAQIKDLSRNHQLISSLYKELQN